MSEEQQSQQNENIEKNCKITMCIVIAVLSLLMSIASLVLSVINFSGGTIGGNQQLQATGKNTISKRYDRGRSLDKALKTGKPIIAFFYTDWCGFCQRFAPTFDKITKDLRIKKKFAIAFINCEDQANQKHMQEYGIQGFPTVYVIKKDGDKKQLDNATFFVDKAKDTVIKDALEIIE
jgi:thiol-disulfide isomerase/thioredoxin